MARKKGEMLDTKKSKMKRVKTLGPVFVELYLPLAVKPYLTNGFKYNNN